MLSEEVSEGLSITKWYPHPPNLDPSPQNLLEKAYIQSKVVGEDRNLNSTVWSELKVKYSATNKWQSIPKELIEKARRHDIRGVEVRKLGPDHQLSGQHGLFSTRKFLKHDIIGEYTGKIVGKEISGHYVAALEDIEFEDSLGIDAQNCGNEMRFINSFLNIDFKPNVTMRTAYINTYPHILIVCIEDIDIGDEILLDYGESYTKAYLTPSDIKKTPSALPPLEELSIVFPGLIDDPQQLE